MTKINLQSTPIVWFDIDDTLIDFRSNSLKAHEKLFEETEIKNYFDTIDEWYNCYEPYNRELWTDYNRGNIDSNYLRSQRFIRPLIEGGMDAIYAREIAPKLDEIYLKLLIKENRMIEGAKELLHQLKNNGATIGVLSNGFIGIQDKKLHAAGIESMIDIIVLSDEIGINKPDKRLYEYAMKKSGDMHASHHIMIGDNPTTDIEGAVNAGWKGILLDQTGMLFCPEGIKKISHLNEIEIEKGIK